MSKKNRKLAREFLFGFSFTDYVRFKNANYHIVSLGDSCLTKTLMVATGFKPRRFYGEKSCPFDLCCSRNFNRITELIENDFSDFFKNINLNNFPHDETLTLEQFQARYSKRIQNFLDIEQSNKKVYYIYSNYSLVPDTKDITRLYEVLKDKRKGKPFELILLTKKYIDVKNVIQIPYEIKIDDTRVNELIIDKFKQYDNKFTRFREYMRKELKKIILYV